MGKVKKPHRGNDNYKILHYDCNSHITFQLKNANKTKWKFKCKMFPLNGHNLTWPQCHLASMSPGLNVAWPQCRLASMSPGLNVVASTSLASMSPGLNVP